MDGKGGLKTIEGGWDEYAHVLYSELSIYIYPCHNLNLLSTIVDQPAGTGYSYTSTNSYLHELDEVRTRLLVWFDVSSHYLVDGRTCSTIFEELL